VSKISGACHLLVILLLSVISTSAAGGYNNNMKGTPTAVLTYLNGNILLRLDNQPASHPLCEHTYFAIVSDNEKGADRMYARLLAAYTQKQPINIGYDDGTRSGSVCASGYIKVHRVG
jgi:hypothetical protein